MVEIGYALSTEEHPPTALVENARRAENAGFTFAMISDHFHPWIERQGEAPFVWNILGALAYATDEIDIGTGVTCPLIRTHPAIIAQAAATTAVMFDDRFFLGLGTGERLNEHVLGDRWPPHHVRLEMLEEAITVIDDLWKGDMMSHDGKHYTVENAKLYTIPDEPPSKIIAAGGESTARFAGKFGDGMVSTSPDDTIAGTFTENYNGDGSTYGMATVCWAESDREAVEIAHEWWPNSALPGQLGQELATPTHFEGASQALTKDDIADSYLCSAEPADHIESIETYVDAGYDHVYIHQVGPNQQDFIDVYEREVLPSFE